MTEYQKMLGGQLYNAQDGELQAMHRTAMELCHALNQLNPNPEGGGPRPAAAASGPDR